jgi:hypothetical protein
VAGEVAYCYPEAFARNRVGSGSRKPWVPMCFWKLCVFVIDGKPEFDLQPEIGVYPEG